MRFVGRKVFIETVDLQVSVLVVRAALDASLRKFEVLQGSDLCPCFVP